MKRPFTHPARATLRPAIAALILAGWQGAGAALAETGDLPEPAAAAPFTMSIGHGGGRLDGVVKTNSYDALDANIHRFEVFELDFEWTADGELVCIHDWEISYTTRFGTPTETAPDHATFKPRCARQLRSRRAGGLDARASRHPHRDRRQEQPRCRA